MQQNDLELAVHKHVIDSVHETVWFRSAPSDIQATLKVVSVGIDQHVRSSIYSGDSDALPVLVAEVTCGEESRRFAFSIGSARDMG